MEFANIVFTIFRGISILFLTIGFFVLDGSAHVGAIYPFAATSISIGIAACIVSAGKNASSRFFGWLQVSILVVDVFIFIAFLHYCSADWTGYLLCSVFIFWPALSMLTDKIKAVLRS